MSLSVPPVPAPCIHPNERTWPVQHLLRWQSQGAWG